MLRASHAALAVVLALASFVPCTHATMITGIVSGVVTEDRSWGPGYHFTPGETISLRYEYDALRTDGAGNPWQFAEVEFTTGGGYHYLSTPPLFPGDGERAGVVRMDADGLVSRVEVYDLSKTAWLWFFPDHFVLDYDFDAGNRGEIFTSVLTTTDAPIAAPEPSTFILGLVGVVLAGAGWMRRRGAWTPAPDSRAIRGDGGI